MLLSVGFLYNYQPQTICCPCQWQGEWAKVIFKGPFLPKLFYGAMILLKIFLKTDIHVKVLKPLRGDKSFYVCSGERYVYIIPYRTL